MKLVENRFIYECIQNCGSIQETKGETLEEVKEAVDDTSMVLWDMFLDMNLTTDKKKLRNFMYRENMI